MPPKIRSLNVDLARVYREPDSRSPIQVLAWGDAVRVVDDSDPSLIEIEFDGAPAFLKAGETEAVIDRKDSRVLKVDFVDVQQGDGSVIETPKGRTVLLDGGDNQLFARYLAARYRNTSEQKPKDIDCIVVTHGDADHFLGLTEISRSETHAEAAKRLFIRPKRVYHNGLVKRPSKNAAGKKRSDVEMLGDTVTVDGKVFITGLEEDLFAVDIAEMNEPFQKWRSALDKWQGRGPIEMRRLAIGMDDAFDFLTDENVIVEVLGPIPEEIDGEPALRFLGDPPKGPRIGHESLSLGEEGFRGKSASHTINGHSVILKVSYGQFSFLFSGDLNDESGRILARGHNSGELSLRSEVFKVPHHGSADFSGAFVQAVSPVVSIVSSGDESARKEYIHPRATIMGTLGKYSRVEEPLIFVTELVAFFNMIGFVTPELHETKNGALVNIRNPRARFFAFERTAYGIVKVRTDGERMLVYTNSGQKQLKEAYAYTMDEWGKPVPVPVRTI